MTSSEGNPELQRLRSDYRRLNASFATSLAFRFGRGGGFCAEMLGLVKSMMSCLDGRERLCLSRGGRPVGIAIANGFSDYFDPLFPEVDAGIFNTLNRQSVRGSGRFPIVRRGVSRLLRSFTGAQRFMMDDLRSPPPRLAVPELGIDMGYWDAGALLLRMIWIYRPEVAKDIAEMVSTCVVPASYLAVHVRRGDRNTETPYAAFDSYVAAVTRARPEGCVVVVASDDGEAPSVLAGLLPSRFQVVSCSVENDRGYYRHEFNALPPAERFRRLKRFLAEVEILRGGQLFIGAVGSNVTYLIEMMKAGQGVVQVR